MILDRIAFRSFQRARLLHVAAAGLLTIPMVLGMKRRPRAEFPGAGVHAHRDEDPGYRPDREEFDDRRPRMRKRVSRCVEHCGRGKFNQVDPRERRRHQEALAYQAEEKIFRSYPPIFRYDKGLKEYVAYHYDKDGVPRHQADKSIVLEHPLREELTGSIEDWIASLPKRKAAKILKKKKYKCWLKFCEVDDDTDADTMLWKLEANYHRLVQNTDWDTPVADMSRSAHAQELNAKAREEHGYRRRGKRRSIQDILLGPAEYYRHFEDDTAINEVKRVGRYKYLNTRDVKSLRLSMSAQKAAYMHSDCSDYDSEENESESPVRIAKAILQSSRKMFQDDDSVVDPALQGLDDARLEYELKCAAVTAWDWNRKSSTGPPDYQYSSSSLSSSSGSESGGQAAPSSYLQNVGKTFLKNVAQFTGLIIVAGGVGVMWR